MASKSNNQFRIINDGKDSESIFESAMRRAGRAVFRLRDKRDLHGLNRRAVAAFGQPSDYIVVGPSGASLCEVKSSNEKSSFPFSCFTKAQRSAMAQCHGCHVGHNYHVYIHNLNDNQWYFTNAEHVVETLKSGSKSMKWDQLVLIGEI